MTRRYDAAEIEPKWQQVWADEGLYRASEDHDDPRPRFYALDMFPYPSGDLHMGHAEAFSGGDAVARYRVDARLQRAASDRLGRLRAAGRERGHQARRSPEGVDLREHRAAGGLVPADGHVVRLERGGSTRAIPPTTGGPSGCSRGSSTKGLAYRKNSPVNWCPHDHTVLANEQVIQGACERCGTMVERRDLTQWFYKITDYAQRLLDDMDDLIDWPERVITMQRNWIGRSEGARGDLHDRRDRRGDRGLHHAPRHPVGRHVLRVRGRPPGGGAAGRAGWHRRIRWRRCANRPGPPRWWIARPPTPRTACSSGSTP